MQLPLLENNITPEQAFGPLSTLVEGSSSYGSYNHLFFGAPYQIGATIIGLIYIFFIVRYWDFLCYFIINAVGFKRTKRDKAHINPAEQINIEVVMTILGVLLMALCVVRVCGLWHQQLLIGLAPQRVVWVVGLSVVLILALTLAFQFGTTMVIGSLCQRTDIGKHLVVTKLLYIAVGLVVITPFAILFLLSAQLPAMVGFWGMVAVVIACVAIYVKETFFFFVGQKISILHWFLYLCALEIFPLSLILSPIVR